MACTKIIAAGMEIQCTPAFGGTNDKLILYNFDDFQAATITYDTNYEDNLVIASITNDTGKQGYLFEGRNNSIGSTESVVQGSLFPQYTHVASFIAGNVDAKALVTLQNLTKAKVIALYESNQRFYVVGFFSGLLCGIERDTNNADTGGTYIVTLTSEKEAQLQKQIAVYTGTYPNDVYDYTASKAVFDGCLTIGA